MAKTKAKDTAPSDKVATFISEVEGWLVCDADGENVYRTTEWPPAVSE